MAEMMTLVDGTSCLHYSTKETAGQIRAALKMAFPGFKFSVRTEYASCYSATEVRWTDGPTQPEVEVVTDQFTSRSFDGQTDSTNYHRQMVNGQPVKYSGWVNVRREISPAVLALATRRMVESGRAEDGSGWSTEEMAYRLARTMRPNGVRIQMKREAVNG